MFPEAIPRWNQAFFKNDGSVQYKVYVQSFRVPKAGDMLYADAEDLHKEMQTLMDTVVNKDVPASLGKAVRVRWPRY